MRFIRDPDGNPIGMRGTATGLGLGGKWFMTDHQNSVISVYDPSRASSTGGAFVGDALYEPDGVTTNAADNNIGFAGGHQIKPGIYHFGRRFYDTATAQWTQPDPLDQASDLTQANRYSYVGAKGVNFIDPTGTHSQTSGDHVVCDSQGCKHRQVNFNETISGKPEGQNRNPTYVKAGAGCLAGVFGGQVARGIGSVIARTVQKFNPFTAAGSCIWGVS